MTTYAIAETVPENCTYLTAGKRYDVVDDNGRGLFRIKNDEGRMNRCLWEGCHHLNDGNWTRVEEEEPAWDSDGFWGPVIEVNGVRPDWLRGHVVCALKTAAGWVCTERATPEYSAETWAWTHDDGEPCITHIRLPTTRQGTGDVRKDNGMEEMNPLDLSDGYRLTIEARIEELIDHLRYAGQSLAIAREAMINAFDKEAVR